MSRRPNSTTEGAVQGETRTPTLPSPTDSCCALARTGLEALHPNLNPAGWTLSTLTLAWVAYPAFNAAFRRLPTTRPGAR